MEKYSVHVFCDDSCSVDREIEMSKKILAILCPFQSAAEIPLAKRPVARDEERCPLVF